MKGVRLRVKNEGWCVFQYYSFDMGDVIVLWTSTVCLLFNELNFFIAASGLISIVLCSIWVGFILVLVPIVLLPRKSTTFENQPLSEVKNWKVDLYVFWTGRVKITSSTININYQPPLLPPANTVSPPLSFKCQFLSLSRRTSFIIRSSQWSASSNEGCLCS